MKIIIIQTIINNVFILKCNKWDTMYLKHAI